MAFLSATVIGTLFHELGHYLVAKLLGYDVKLHFASTSWKPETRNENLISRDSFWILISGPIQTLLTGTFGLILIYFNRETYRQIDKLSLFQWVLIFLSLFWTRQVANFAIWTMNRIQNTNYRSNNDEIKIAKIMKIPQGVILETTALIGFVVLILIIFKFVPKQQRLPFIAAGFFGSLLGFMLWIELLGKYIIP